MPVCRPIRLPRQWPGHVKSGILHAISLASVVLSFARGRVTGHRRLQAQLEQATTEIALLREELYIKDSRWERARIASVLNSSVYRRLLMPTSDALL